MGQLPPAGSARHPAAGGPWLAHTPRLQQPQRHVPDSGSGQRLGHGWRAGWRSGQAIPKQFAHCPGVGLIKVGGGLVGQQHRALIVAVDPQQGSQHFQAAQLARRVFSDWTVEHGAQRQPGAELLAQFGRCRRGILVKLFAAGHCVELRMLADHGQLAGNEDPSASESRVERVVAAVRLGDQLEQRALARAACRGQHEPFAGTQLDIHGAVDWMLAIIADLQIRDFQDVLRIRCGASPQLTGPGWVR